MRPSILLSLVILALAVPTAVALDGSVSATGANARVAVDGAPSAPSIPHAALPAPSIVPALPSSVSTSDLPAAPIAHAPLLPESSPLRDLGASANIGLASVPTRAPAEPPMTQAVKVAAKAAPAVAAAGGLFALLQALGVWRFALSGGVALYSRLTKSELLDNEKRDHVYKLIQQNPGIGASEIAKQTGLGWGTTVYHLDRLERAQMVSSERSGLHRCFFALGAVAREARKGIGALKQDTTRSVAQVLVTRPGITQSELCDALQLSASALSKQVTKMEEAGLVRREREWKSVRIFPTETLPALLENAPVAPLAMAAPIAA